MKLFNLKGKTAFIPGGYGGIGAAISRGLADAGAKITIAGRDEKKARALAKKIGRGARGVGLDVEDVQAIRDTRAPEMSLEAAMDDQRLMDQIYASLRTENLELGTSDPGSRIPDPRRIHVQ